VIVLTGQILTLSNTHVYDAVCSVVCRAQLLLKWSEQTANDSSEAAEQLQTSVSTLLKVSIVCIYVWWPVYQS